MTTKQSPHAAALPASIILESDLVEAAKDGDETAVRELIKRLNPRLFRVARGIVASDAEAEEVVQEAYLKAFTQLSSFRGDSKFTTWITRIALNAALMQARRARPKEEYNTVSEDENVTSIVLRFPGFEIDRPEAELGRAQSRALLEDSVSELPAELRLPFLLRETEGMSVKDIARDLSLNPITVKTRLFRARRRLRQAIERRVGGGFDTIFPFDGARCAHMADTVINRLKGSG